MRGLSPDRPGYWVYLEAEDGTLTELELSREECHARHAETLREDNVRVDRLNQHPLNLAAAEHLKNRPQVNFDIGSLKRIAVLRLARLALPDFEEDRNPWMKLDAFARAPGRMEVALEVLEEDGLTTDELRALSPEEAAERIAEALGLFEE
ncbi:MAG: hypothetical protein SFU53_15015 [Terrimicrobiaceae bacterium]|nr:hypothetical protein [Terrimicrobiaceae bacterium]